MLVEQVGLRPTSRPGERSPNRAAVVAVMTMFVSAAVLTGCAGDHERQERTQSLTPEALAAVALEHVGDPADSAQADQAEGAIVVVLRFDETSQTPQLFGVGIGPPSDEFSCGAGPTGGCESMDVDGDRVSVMWTEGTPGEGVVRVWAERDGGVVATLYTGDDITGDPRELDLSIDVDIMIDVVLDERIAQRTTKDAIEMGKDLDIDVVG